MVQKIKKMLQTLKKWRTVKQPKIVGKKYLHSVSNCVSDACKQQPQQQGEITFEGASFFLQTKDFKIVCHVPYIQRALTIKLLTEIETFFKLWKM